MFFRIGQVAKLAGISNSSIRRWEKEKILEADFRTPGKHRRYNYKKILRFFGLTKKKVKKQRSSSMVG
jgi:DNA-binding transcriptional MerR regulator